MEGKRITINRCPNCGDYLTPNKKLAQGVVECIPCDARWWIILTSVNSNKKERERNTKTK